MKFKEDLENMKEEQEEKLGHPAALIYIDESAIKEEVTRIHAYAKRGEKVQGKTQGKRPHKINMVAALNGKEMLAPFTFEGTMDSDLFNAYLYLVLLPLVPFGAIIIMDNARYHLSQETRELIEEKGCRLIYLSPYSPELNRIEKYWGILKRYLQRYRCFFSSLEDTLFFIFNTFKPFRSLLGT
jgi:transposase